MILADSSVWIDFLSLKNSEAGRNLETLLRPVNQVVMTGIVFQEVLQGIRSMRSSQLTQKLLGRLPFIIPTPQTHLKAAEIFKKISAKGKILSTIDALIASLAIENRIPLFTQGTDFQTIASHTELKLFQ